MHTPYSPRPSRGLLIGGLVFLLYACSNQEVNESTDSTTNHPVSPAPAEAQSQIEEIVVTGHKRPERRVRQLGKVQDQALASWAPSVVPQPVDRERYPEFANNGILAVVEQPVSTFAIDVDTAAYSNLRRQLSQGIVPRSDAIRIEELVNYFDYNYPRPVNDQQPFAVYTEVGPSPWHPDRHLLHIGLQGQGLTREELPAANLVFLIDVSGSMQSKDKLPLLRNAMKLLTRQLRPADKVGLVVYAGAAGVVLEPTSGRHTSRILNAIDQLEAGGSTNGGAGIELAYRLAQDHFIDGGVNRVILATDGDFNVGTTNQRALKDLVVEKRESGVALTVLGFGGGNYNDALMQELAQAANGNAAYIDTLNEARKVLVDELAATLAIIAKDVKIQVEFNPAAVSEYRLVGFETRALAREDFNNDKVDAGEIGAGHSVTAIYEISLRGSKGEALDPLRYGEAKAIEARPSELAFLRLRYKAPAGKRSRLLEQPIAYSTIKQDLQHTSELYRFSAAVAGFGQLLRDSDHAQQNSYSDILTLASQAKGTDAFGYRGEFLNLVRTAQALGQPLDEQGKVTVGYRGD